MLVKAGEENAGLMDIGDGYGVVFKIESHNHPSAIEPFHHPGLAAAAKRWPTLWPRALSARAAQAIVAP